LAYYHAATGIGANDPRYIVLSRLTLGNNLGTESLNVSINAKFYGKYNALVAEAKSPLPLTIAPNSNANALSKPVFVSSDVTRIVITLDLRSISYYSQMEHVIVP
jgi:hypothetical protein